MSEEKVSKGGLGDLLRRYMGRLLRLVPRIFFNEPLVMLSELYLRHYYRWKRKWGRDPRDPKMDWYDHREDLYHWSKSRNPLWVDRGIFSRQVMYPGCRVLDLCCGDGFYPYYFYAEVPARIDAVDRDHRAIKHAMRWHAHPNISYWVKDVLKEDFPGMEYDVICWDAGIQYFTPDETRAILSKSFRSLEPTKGILTGYTILAEKGEKYHRRHKYEFSSQEELVNLLEGIFPFAGTLETRYPNRRNIYFRAAFSRDRLGGFLSRA
ncbi:MAG: class I SAM-dependent methyltransferase [Thermodesulfobacteriota bacterium]